MPEFLFNKVTGQYLAILLKENTPIQVFYDEFCKKFKIPVLPNTPKRILLHKNILPINQKKLSEKAKKLKLIVRKTTTQPEKNLNTTYFKSSYSFII